MGVRIPTYRPGSSPVHRCDARVKLVVLLAFSIGIFFVQSWWVMALFALAVVVAMAISRIAIPDVNRLLVPVYVLAAFSVLFNAIAHPGLEGLSLGLLFGVRMVVLVAASFVVCLTTGSAQLLEAFGWFIGPLRRFGVPVDDIAFTLALSVRFIPVIEQQFSRIRTAQIARGAEATGSFTRKLKVWGSAFSALFIGLFRQADSLASAMDARCYGASSRRARLPRQ